MIPDTMKTSASSLSRTFGFFASVSTALVAVSLSQAATIVPETWYSSHSGGTTVGDGVQFATNEGTSVRHILTYFTPTTLSNVGDSVNVSLTFSAQFTTDPASNNTNFGFSLYNSDGNRISADDLGSSSSTFNSYRGYRVNMRTKPANASQAALLLRTRSGNNDILGSSTAHPVLIEEVQNGGSSGSNLVSGNQYDVEYTITRTGADELGISFTITGMGLSNYSYSWTVASTTDGFTTTFDTFAITLASQSIFESITLKNVTVSTIPEPGAAAALTGLGALGLVACRRRRR
jgi:PEP-CTERM motif.